MKQFEEEKTATDEPVGTPYLGGGEFLDTQKRCSQDFTDNYGNNDNKASFEPEVVD